MMRKTLVMMGATAATLVSMAAGGLADTILTPGERTGLTLTVSQSDTALVHDRRAAALNKGVQSVVFEGIAHQARDGGAVLNGPGLGVLEQGFSLQGLDGGQLLEQSVGQDVSVIWPAGQEERARILSAGSVPIFQINGKVVAGQPSRIIYDKLPAGLSASPSYQAQINSESGAKREIELSYLTGGLGWQAEYVAELNDDKMVLSSWANIINNTGTAFPKAQIRLLAGDVGRLRDDARAALMMKSVTSQALRQSAASREPAREAFGPYHLYTLAQPISLRDGERKQVPMLAPASLTIDRQLVLDPMPPDAWRLRQSDSSALHPLAVLTFRNTLGQPLPAGTVRLFQRNKDGVAMVGEDIFPATPAGQTARLTLGSAFDITARRVQVDFQQVSTDVNEAAWEVKLANAGDKPAKVIVREGFGGDDWLVLEESTKHVKESAFVSAWTVSVPAQGEATLKYRIRVRN